MTVNIVRTLYSALLIGLVGCGGSGGDSASPQDDSPPVQRPLISWSGCAADSQLECATLMVPLDHRQPDGRQIEIALNRLPASGDSPLGSLLLNPGGPGGSGTELLDSLAPHAVIPEVIRDAYHLIGFDPRGVNLSTPVDCREFGLDEIDDYPLDISDLQQIEQASLDYVAACSNQHGDYLQHLGTQAVVDDMEQLRQALGEPSINMIGYSYGTRLAAVYAQTYPQRVGRLILDASVPPVHDVVTLFSQQLAALEGNFERLAQSCLAFSDCDPIAYQNRLEARVAELIVSDFDLETEVLATVLIVATQEPDLLPDLAQPLYQYSLNFEITDLLPIALELELDEDASFDSDTVARAVICADDPRRLSVEEIEALRVPFNDTSDIFAEAQLAGIAVCSGWPESIAPLPEVATTQAPATLVIGGTADAQTPLQWSRDMAAAIGGHFWQSDHLGHTVVFTGASDCTDQVAERFLLSGELPETQGCSAAD